MKKGPSWPVVTGPLGKHADGFRDELVGKLRFSVWAASRHMYVFADVSDWLAGERLDAGDFDAVRVAGFLADRAKLCRARPLSRRGLEPMLAFLVGAGIVAADEPVVPAGPIDVLVARFAAHLVEERGLSAQTIVGYERTARMFLTAYAPAPEVEGCGLGRLGAGEINAFVLARCAALSVGSAGNMVTGMRALLRFAHLRGYTTRSLADCVPTAASWRDSGRSRALSPSDVERLLAACDRSTMIGRRDLAVITVLARLGLRSGEVAGLVLDDIDWRAGELAVTGKNGRRERLPVPVDVGEALADYCQTRRPATEHRAVFVHGRAPHGRLSSSAVGHVVVRAGRRAGLDGRVGAHRLRHSAATAMRRAGAPMFEIGQVLRHRFVVTTAIYAKDDIDALARIARPWPAVTQ